jgi:predicted flap endonuclease-1-like 5' DNA nuclease
MKQFAKIGGMIVGLGAGVVAALWLLKDKIAGPASAPVESADAPASRVAPSVEEAPVPPADDLTGIKGIGPVYAARLAEAGIASFAALATADAADLAEQTDAPEGQVEDWISQAQDLVAG